MDAHGIRGLLPMPTWFLKRFDDCFSHKGTRTHLATYLEGQLAASRERTREWIARPSFATLRYSSFDKRTRNHAILDLSSSIN